MSPAERSHFLTHPVRTGKLATVNDDGSPHLAPIWFALDGDDLVFNTGLHSVKCKNIQRTGRAAICVDDDQPPFSYVTVSGPATLSEEPSEVLRWATTIGGRYMGTDKAEALGKRNSGAGHGVVRIRPEHVVAIANLAD
jgi:hypothetical protein